MIRSTPAYRPLVFLRTLSLFAFTDDVLASVIGLSEIGTAQMPAGAGVGDLALGPLKKVICIGFLHLVAPKFEIKKAGQTRPQFVVTDSAGTSVVNGRSGRMVYAAERFSAAFFPLLLSRTMSKVTFWPSLKSDMPERSTAEM
ncbi:hypothetical protein GGE12_003190 [Rhizobium mongolense]|uniref:Uncharacterized protein n=1 Tax=Rhizobium mongolense TaxID=57676 RepID=A0A7W6RNU8_9HYPH|nr:hypothetical protein [Rhizobium mongolense]